MLKPLPFRKLIHSYSLAGLFKYFYLRMQGKTIYVTGNCRGCGSCCRCISLEGPNGWLRSEKVFEQIVGKFPEYSRFVMIGRDPQGFLLFSCSWVTAQGTCGDYEKRLALCRRFPESSLAFSGGELPSGCSYRFVKGVVFQKVLDAALHKQK